MENPVKTQLVESAIELFGAEVVHEVITLVSVSDPDGVWSLYDDFGKDDHMACVEYLYFERD
jgi:hypothetical protein